MSTQYTTEPPPTATVLVHTTAGPITISLFATQTPLTCRNFLQHCLDGTYDGVIFHRVATGFVIQTGDPTGTGDGGTNIYEDGDVSAERYGEAWGRVLRLPEDKWVDKIVFGDEVHSRLKFNRRGLVGMAKMTADGQGQYGTQWFITLGDCRAELDGKCTMFGRVEGDGIYSVLKIAAGELVEGTERPTYPEKITKVEVLEMPDGEVWKVLKRRERIAQRTAGGDGGVASKKKDKTQKKKGGKALLSFGGDEEDSGSGTGVVVRPKKAKFNPNLIEGSIEEEETKRVQKSKDTTSTNTSRKRKSPEPDRNTKSSASRSPEVQSTKRRKPSFHESTTQLPLRDPESPSRSPSPEVSLPNKRKFSDHRSASALEAEIAALKATMRREAAPTVESKKKLSALEAMIPATSTRGRKRPRPGEAGSAVVEDRNALATLNAFRARLKQAAATAQSEKVKFKPMNGKHVEGKVAEEEEEQGVNADEAARDEEAALCDLHFIANCQSCSDWATEEEGWRRKDADNEEDEGRDKGFLSHALTFEKDRLGKDLTWRKKNEEELVVIDPREKEKELGIGQGKRRNKSGKDMSGRSREWDGRR